MKTKFFAVLAAAIMLTVGVSNAQASTLSVDLNQFVDGSVPDEGVDFNALATYTDLETTIDGGTGKRAQVVDIFGTLAPQSVMTVDFSLSNLTGSVKSAYLDADMEIDVGGIGYYLSTALGETTDYSSDLVKDLLQITGSWDVNSLTGQLVLVNKSLSDALLSLSFFTKLVGSADFDMAVSVTAVPLPAALPLFGLGIASLAGYGIKRRKEAA